MNTFFVKVNVARANCKFMLKICQKFSLYFQSHYDVVFSQTWHQYVWLYVGFLHVSSTTLMKLWKKIFLYPSICFPQWNLENSTYLKCQEICIFWDNHCYLEAIFCIPSFELTFSWILIQLLKPPIRAISDNI